MKLNLRKPIIFFDLETTGTDISKDRIVAAGCILPVSHSFNIPKSLGLRHRAALGMSERSDAMCVIISEETGRISVSKNGELKLDISPEELEKELSSYSE